MLTPSKIYSIHNKKRTPEENLIRLGTEKQDTYIIKVVLTVVSIHFCPCMTYYFC